MKLPKVSWRGLAIGAVLVLILVPTFARNIGRISSPGIPPIKEWFSDLGLDTPGKLLLVVLLAIVAFHWRKPLGGIIAGALLLLILLFLLNWTGLIMSPGVTKWRQEAGNLPQQTETVTFQTTVSANPACDGETRLVEVQPDSVTLSEPGCHAEFIVREDSPGDCVFPIDMEGNPMETAICKDTPADQVGKGIGWKAAECETWLEVTYYPLPN